MQINLLPDLVLKRRHDAMVKRIAMLILAAWIGIVLLLTLGVLGLKLWHQASLSSAKSNKAKINAQVNSSANVAFRKQALAVQASLNELSKLYQHQQRFSQVYSRLAEVLPKSTQIQSVLLTSDGQMQLAGVTDNYFDAGKLVASFKDSSKDATSDEVTFSNITLNGANLNEGKVSFSITTNYAFPTGDESDEATK